MTIGVYAIATGDNCRAELQSKVMQTLAAHKDIVQVHGFYYSEKEKYLSVDVVPDISAFDSAMRSLIVAIYELGVKEQMRKLEQGSCGCKDTGIARCWLSGNEWSKNHRRWLLRELHPRPRRNSDRDYDIKGYEQN